MADKENPPYEYAPLTTEDSIRVAELQPGDETDPLACIFSVTSPSDTLHYEALSYVWGGLHKDQSILCDGKSLPITANLHEALIHLRFRDKPRLLWADAMSINQADDDEKASQVAMMSRIYQSAQRTVIWLGPEQPDTELAIKALNQVVAHCLKESSKSFDKLNDLTKMQPQDLFKDILSHSKATALDPEDEAAWSSLSTFFQVPWFGRIWIVQEVCLGQDPIMVCGSKTVEWGSLLLFSIWVDLHLDSLRTLKAMHIHMRNPAVIFLHIVHCFSLDPSALLSTARKFDATDPRDKIYALMAFEPLSFHPLWKIIPDYRKPVRQVYTEAATSCILQSRNLGVLSQVHHLVKEQQVFTLQDAEISNDFPSWVPHWHINRQTMDLAGHKHDASKGVHTAFEGVNEEYMKRHIRAVRPKSTIDFGADLAVIRFLPDPDVVQVRAIMIDTATFGTLVLHARMLEPGPGFVPTALLVLQSEMARTPELEKDQKFGRTARALAMVHTFGSGGRGDSQSLDSASTENMVASDIEKEVHNNMMCYLKLTLPLANCFLKDEEISPEISSNLEKQSGLDDEYLAAANLWKVEAATHTHMRRIFNTKNGHFGNGPAVMQPGDVVAVLPSAKMPFVLRPKGDHYQLLGACYLYGFMNGEAVEQMAEGILEWKWIDIR